MAHNDLSDAQGTYGGFVGVAKWATLIVAALVAFVIILIS